MTQLEIIASEGSKLSIIDQFLRANAKIVDIYRRNTIPDWVEGRWLAGDPEIVHYYVTSASTGAIGSIEALNAFMRSLIPPNLIPDHLKPYYFKFTQPGFLLFLEQLGKSEIERLLVEAGMSPNDLVIVPKSASFHKDLNKEVQRRITITPAPSEITAQYIADYGSVLSEGRIEDAMKLHKEVVRFIDQLS